MRKARYPVYYFFLLTLVVEIQILKPALWKQEDFLKKDGKFATFATKYTLVSYARIGLDFFKKIQAKFTV